MVSYMRLILSLKYSLFTLHGDCDKSYMHALATYTCNVLVGNPIATICIYVYNFKHYCITPPCGLGFQGHFCRLCVL